MSTKKAIESKLTLFDFVKDRTVANTSYTRRIGSAQITVAFEHEHHYFVELERDSTRIALFESSDIHRLDMLLGALFPS